MKITLTKNEELKCIKYRNRFEYVVFLVPLIGTAITIVIALLQGSLRRVTNVCIFNIIMFISGGALVYIFQISSLSSYYGLVCVLFVILFMMWICVPMYSTYILVFHLDDAKLYELVSIGYETDVELTSYKPHWLLR